MKLYMGVFAKPVDDILLYTLPGTFYSEEPSAPLKLFSTPTNSEDIIKKLETVEKNADLHFHVNDLCIEARYFPPKEWEVLEKDSDMLTLKIDDLKAFAEKKEDDTCITITSGIMPSLPSIMFKCD